MNLVFSGKPVWLQAMVRILGDEIKETMAGFGGYRSCLVSYFKDPGFSLSELGSNKSTREGLEQRRTRSTYIITRSHCYYVDNRLQKGNGETATAGKLLQSHREKRAGFWVNFEGALNRTC